MQSAAHVAIFDHLSVLGDPVRCRVVRLLEEHELTVSELCEVLQMPQSSVSRHLKLLANDGWLSSRRDGTSRLYSVPADALDAGARRLFLAAAERAGARHRAYVNPNRGPGGEELATGGVWHQ